MSETTESAKLPEEIEARAMNSLLYLMGELSEDCYCAGWLIDLEFTLWDFAHQGIRQRWGVGEVTPRHCTDLLRLAGEAGGWWTYDHGHVFVPLAEWEKRYAASDYLKWRAEHADALASPPPPPEQTAEGDSVPDPDLVPCVKCGTLVATSNRETHCAPPAAEQTPQHNRKENACRSVNELPASGPVSAPGSEGGTLAPCAVTESSALTSPARTTSTPSAADGLTVRTASAEPTGLTSPASITPTHAPDEGPATDGPCDGSCAVTIADGTVTETCAQCEGPATGGDAKGGER